MQLDTIKAIYFASGVNRWHIHRTIQTQTIAEHQWGVAALVMVLDPYARPEVLKAALMHDMGEAYVGDLPAPLKWAHPQAYAEIASAEAEYLVASGLPDYDLTPEEKLLLKICDYSEAMMFALSELSLGNRHFVQIFIALTRFVDAELAKALDYRWYMPALGLVDELTSKSASLSSGQGAYHVYNE